MGKPNLISDEIVKTVPIERTIQCRTCSYRDDGTVWSQPFTKGCCQKYRYPSHKPVGVLLAQQECIYYKKG